MERDEGAARRSLAERIGGDKALDIVALLRPMSELKISEIMESWCVWARPDQLPPISDWRVWLMLAGRGFGKTRAGAEWVHNLAEQNPGVRIALIGPTEGETRAVMIEGASGVMATGRSALRPKWEPSAGRLTWPTGAIGELYSGANPEGLRGPEHDYAWCDELAKWECAEAAWDNMMLGLRRGARPQVLATTTPRPIPLLRRLLKSDKLALTRGRTHDNLSLSKDYIAGVDAMYAGTTLGRQEIEGELIEDVEGALWSRALIERQRVDAAPETVRVVIGVDPPASAGGDACGIVVVALGRDGCGYVIEDASVAGRSPDGWARAVASAAARHGADRIVAEGNMGGDMVESVLHGADDALPVEIVRATRGKSARAEPVARYYERGRAWHVGAWPALEDELCGMMTGGGYEGPGRSPDRADALVWAMAEVMRRPRSEARVRVM